MTNKKKLALTQILGWIIVAFEYNDLLQVRSIASNIQTKLLCNFMYILFLSCKTTKFLLVEKSLIVHNLPSLERARSYFAKLTMTQLR